MTTSLCTVDDCDAPATGPCAEHWDGVVAHLVQLWSTYLGGFAGSGLSVTGDITALNALSNRMTIYRPAIEAQCRIGFLASAKFFRSSKRNDALRALRSNLTDQLQYRLPTEDPQVIVQRYLQAQADPSAEGFLSAVGDFGSLGLYVQWLTGYLLAQDIEENGPPHTWSAQQYFDFQCQSRAMESISYYIFATYTRRYVEIVMAEGREPGSSAPLPIDLLSDWEEQNDEREAKQRLKQQAAQEEAAYQEQMAPWFADRDQYKAQRSAQRRKGAVTALGIGLALASVVSEERASAKVDRARAQERQRDLDHYADVRKLRELEEEREARRQKAENKRKGYWF